MPEETPAEYAGRVKNLSEKLKTPDLSIEGFDGAEVKLIREIVGLHARQWAGALPKSVGEAVTVEAPAPTSAEFSELERQTLATLETTFDETSSKLAHGLSWETVEASLAADKEAIGILGDLIARGGKPTVTADRNGEIRWSEAVADVPMQDFKGIPMYGLAYDEVGQAKAPKNWGCRGNALESARRIHPRVTLTDRAESQKLAKAGLVQDNGSFPWLNTPYSERGDKNDQYGGLAWYGCSGAVAQSRAHTCFQNRRARFSLAVKKIEITA